MSFLNWILLGGALTFAAPLIIHLLNRSRFKVVDWGAMHLLESALQVNSKRIEWQAWLLLFIRCLIPVLLALALARPVFTSWRSANAAGDKSVVLIIDNSLSMQALVSGGKTRFDRAIEQASAVIEQLKPSTELSLWTAGGIPTDELGGSSFDHRRVLNKLKSLRSGAGSVQVHAVLNTALKQVAAMQNANREVILISDFQSHEWQQMKESERAALKTQLTADPIATQIVFLPIRDQAASTNLSIAIDALESPFVVLDQPFRVSAQVRNHGASEVTDVAVVLTIAERELASRRVTIPGSGVTQIVFDCQIETVGAHVVNVRIDDAAGFEGDNAAEKIVAVRAPLQVLIVDERAAAPELQRASGYLSLALSPFLSNETGKNVVQVRVTPPERIARGEIAEHNVVVLADVSKLNDRTADEVAQFVRDGGGLLIFCGNSLNRDWYNNHWGAKNKNPLLPAEFVKPSKPQEASERIAVSPIQHPSLSSLDRSGVSDFAAVEFKSWRKLEKVADEDTEVLLKLENDEPLLLAKSFEKGHVMLFASSADTSESNIPLRPVFVPLMQGLVQWLASSSEAPRNLVTGQPLLITLDSQRASATPDETSQVSVTRPDNSKVEIPLVGNVATFAETNYPGVYRVTDPRSPANSINYAVAASLEESQLQFLSTEQLSDIADSIGASVAADAGELTALQSLRANGREIWRWILLGMVSLLFVELWWQQRIMRGSQ